MNEPAMTTHDVQFVTDSAGHRTAVLMPLDQYEELLEMLEDLYIGKLARESKNEPTRPFADFWAELRAAGEIDV